MRLLAAFALACAASACSAVLSPDDLMGEPLSAREFCDELAASYCEAHADCCAPEDTVDDAACRNTAQIICNELVNIASDVRTAYDGERAKQVLAESDSYFASCDPEILPYLLSSAGLVSTLEGTVAPGNACSTSSTPDLAEFFSCEDDRACVRVASSQWSCLAKVPEGGSCRTDSDCEEGLYCDSGWLGIVDGSCLAQLPVDAACSRAQQCESSLCTDSVCQALTVETVYCVLSR